MSMDTLDKVFTCFLFLLTALPFIMFIQFKWKKRERYYYVLLSYSSLIIFTFTVPVLLLIFEIEVWEPLHKPYWIFSTLILPLIVIVMHTYFVILVKRDMFIVKLEKIERLEKIIFKDPRPIAAIFWLACVWKYAEKYFN
ncbi:hypothetical protein ABE41_018040 [Fictibacillus arsenicus]|uniref:Uncharacterized protein n=1 Tax=Fictibacillus arsenicus TaxID=255247 RepID=A0A1B1Z908_9BACL|nr:hypothetical protein [Fictibacillus arsenicus]ANX13916.1 hypothetical protein ABE41_018040 [Fictibacillus arsenicus]